MNDDERKKMLEQRFEEVRARIKAEAGEGNVGNARKIVASLIGSQMAAQGVEMEFDDSVPDEVREAALQGYLAQSLGELAQTPPVVMDVPLLRRIFASAVSLLKTRKPEEP